MHLFISGLEIRSGSTRLIVSGISMCLCLSLNVTRESCKVQFCADVDKMNV